MCAKGESEEDVDECVRNIEPNFPPPEECDVGSVGGDAPAVCHVVIRKGLCDVAEGGNVCHCPPDEHVVVVVPVEGHEEVEEEHEGEEDCDDDERLFHERSFTEMGNGKWEMELFSAFLLCFISLLFY